MSNATFLIHLEAGAVVVLTVFVFRAFPVLVGFSIATRSTWQRALTTILYSGLAWLAIGFTNSRPLRVLICYGYVAAATVTLYLIARVVRFRLALFGLCVGLLQILPSIFGFIPPSARTLILVVGWEASLSVYSYCTDTVDKPRRLDEYMFFVLVNPSLVYRRRGAKTAPASLCIPGLVRALAGAFSILLSGALVSVERVHLNGSSLLFVGALGFAEFYLAHTGLASLQIGLMKQLGYTIPERYLSPILATSPRDFWLRWNTYVGSWVQIYVFKPLASWVLPWSRRIYAPRSIVQAGLILLSFLSIGILHDLYGSVLHLTLLTTSMGWFLFNGVLLIAWEAAAIALKRTHMRTLPRPLANCLVLAFAIGLTWLLRGGTRLQNLAGM